MDGFVSLLGVRRRIMWNTLRTVGQHSRLKLASIVALGGGIWIGLYVFPYFGFNAVAKMLPYEAGIAEMLVSLFFLLLTIMLVFSNAVIAYTALFRSEEAAFLRSCPLPSGTIFLYKLAESLTFSSWAFVLLGVPIMLAYGVHKLAPWYYFAAMAVFFASFILIPAGLGALIALAISTFLRPWMRRLLTWAAVGIALFALVAGPAYLYRQRAAEPDIFGATALLRHVSFTHEVWWPSSWISRGLTLCADRDNPGRMEDVLFYLGLLASHSLLLCLLAHMFASRAYDGAWDRMHSQSSRRQSARWLARVAGLLPRSPMIQLVLKDVRTFVRDPVQWTQCAVLFGLLGLYILNLRNLRHPSTKLVWRNLTTFLNLGSISLVLATLTTRFVFPLFSLEGRRFWLLGLVPVSRRYVLWSKLVFSFGASLFITGLLMVLSDLMLGEPLWMMALHLFTVAMISMGLSGLAVGLSVLYPNLRESSPAKIVSGFGGTLNLILSLLYVSVVVTVEALPIHLFAIGRATRGEMVAGLWGAVAVILVLSVAAFAVPVWLGSKALAKMEF